MTHRTSGRRRIGALVAVPLAGVLSLSACSTSGDSGSDAAAGSTGFSFLYPTSTTTESPYETLAKKYTQETGVKVDTRKLPNDSYGTSLRTQLQGGNAADLMVVAPGRGQEYAVLPLAEAGLLEPLSAGSTKVVPEASADLVELDGKTYAQPTDIVPVGMAWNSGAAQQSGAQFPADTAALLSLCQKLASDGKSLLAVAGSAPPNVGLMAMSMSASRVYAQTPDWNTQRADGKVTFAGDGGWKDVVTTIDRMNKGGCFQKGAAGGGFDAITQGLARGTSLGAFIPGGAATEIMNNAKGVTLEIRAFPPASGGKEYLLASPNYAISINAKADAAKKQAAQAFLEWLAEPDNAAEFTKIEGQVPITGVGGAQLAPQYAPVKTLLADGDYAPLPNLSWPNPSVYDELAKGLQGLVAGKGDVQSVLESADKAWDSK
ncbi:ABC transporter substrate-binding protein [Actinoplanes sp. URMC 104]|uniref:ABC transporter substrate-binding protein n=1 Tax=Actinoplanes sp. URMC 104 TaxID=3423409 RepID=UPI003F1BB57F